ncbi:MAG: hypothetical protein R3Y27_08285 [Clostridia bacterium]
MKSSKILRKAICVFLCVAIMIMPLTQAASALVVYPIGVTEAKAEESIGKTDILIESVVDELTGGTLAELIMPELYQSNALSGIMVVIYQAMMEYESTMSTIGIDISVSGVASKLSAYPEVYAKLMEFSTTSWDYVDLGDANWNLTDKYEFASAVAAMLSPLNDVLYALLCNGTYSFGSILIFNNLVSFSGDYGYENTIIPLLENFGCVYIKDATEFYTQAEADKNTMISNILLDLLYFAEEILAAPAQMLSENLPNIVYFLLYGGFTDVMESLISPATVAVLGLDMTESLMSSLTDTFENPLSFAETDDFDEMLSSLTGDSGFELAPLDFEQMANCGTVVDGKVVSNTSDAFILILTFIIDTFKLNQDSIALMAGDEGSEIVNSLTSLFDISTSDLIAVIVNLLTSYEGTTNNYRWTYSNYTATEVTYSTYVTTDNALTMVNGLDAVIDELMLETGAEESLSDTISKAIYSNNLVTLLATTIYSLFATEEVSQIVGLLGIPTTTSGLASYLSASQFTAAKETLTSVSSWEELDGVEIDWGFEDGSKEGFITAATYVLLPLTDIFYMILAEGNITLFDAIDLYGSNGYETGIIPLLENFGVSADSIKTYEEYKATASTSQGITDILNSLCSLIDQLIAAPVYTATAIIPNIVYFLENDGLTNCIENLLYPITYIAETLGIDDILDTYLSDFTDVDVLDSLTSAIPEFIEGLSFESIDLTAYSSLGTLVELDSKATYLGEATTRMYVQSDQSAVLVTLMRYLVDLMKIPGNDSFLTSLMSGMTSSNEMFTSFTDGITTQLATMSTDEMISWFYSLFFQERVVEDVVVEEEYVPTIVYEEDSSISPAVLFAIFLIIASGGVILFLRKDKIKAVIKKSKDKQQKIKEEKLS